MNLWKRKAALFLTSQAISLFGSSLVQFAIVWHVTLSTSSGVLVSLLTICSFVPQFLISFFSGVWADRYSKKALIIGADLTIALTTLILALLMPKLSDTALIGALMAASVVRSLGAGVQTPAVNALIPELVPADALMRFNGVNATIQSVVQFAAPAAAGAVLSYLTLQSSLLIDVATAAAGIGILGCLALPKREAKPLSERLGVFDDLKLGFRYAKDESFVGKLLLSFGIFILLCVPAGFLATLFVSRYYGDTYWDLTLVEVIGFVGMTAGGVLIGAWGGFQNRVKTLLVGMVAFGLLAVLMGAVLNFPLYLVLMAIYGVALTMVQTASTTLLQENAAPEMQGRVFGFFGAMYSGFLSLGMAVFGPLSDAVSMRLLMVVSGVLLLVMAAVLKADRTFYRIGEKAKSAESAGE